MSALKRAQRCKAPTSDAGRLSLNDCPFCRTSGGLAAGPRDDGYEGKWSISCVECGLVGPLGSDEAHAAEVWNSFCPPNPLIDCTAETLDRVAIMVEWMLYHPLKPPAAGRYTEGHLDRMRCGDMLVTDMIREAAAFEARRTSRMS